MRFLFTALVKLCSVGVFDILIKQLNIVSFCTRQTHLPR